MNKPNENSKNTTDKKDNKLPLAVPTTDRVDLREVTLEMQESYLDYAMSVIVARALPDVRDGLKPVHRRILYAMHDLGLKHTAKLRKSATVVGEVLGKYHPHGDVAVYDSMVRLAQDFSMRYPLITGQGNFGSIDGDSAAAMRYTEAKLAPIAEEMLGDIDRDTVDFIDNYDKSRLEPQVMPARLPNLILNGTMGIAVGMATNIPPHNLTEVAGAIELLLSNPDASIDELMEFIKGPDFPGGGFIYDAKAIKAAYESGKGGIVMRAKTEIAEAKKGRWQIIVSELPYQVNKSELMIKIADLVKDKKIEGIRDLRDESDKDGIRAVIELKGDVDPQRVLNSLFKMTDLQKTFHMNMLALIGGLEPRVLNLKAVLLQYIEHQKVVVVRRTQFLLRRAKERLHILEGLSIALKNIDEVIRTIKKSETKEVAHYELMKKFKLSDIQATAILEMKLSTLAGLERKKIEDEREQKLKEIAEYEDILAHPKRIVKIISDELEAVREKYGDDRRTKVIKGAVGQFSDEDLIPKLEQIMAITHEGYIKRMNPDVYRPQRRGGKGIIGAVTKEEDAVETVMALNTHDNLLFFTNRGKVLQTKAYEIPEASRISKGQSIVNFLQISTDEKITSTMINKKLTDTAGENYVIMATKHGIIKKVKLSDFDNVRRSGIIAIKLQGNDELKWAEITSGKDEIVLVTAKGQSIRFKESKVRPMGRAAGGVKAMRLGSGDFICAMDVVSQTRMKDIKSQKLLTVMENGFGKMTELAEYKVQGRGGSGIKTAKITPKTGLIVFAVILGDEAKEKDLLVISQKGQTIRVEVSAIPFLGRATQGVRIMRLNAGDKIASAAAI